MEVILTILILILGVILPLTQFAISSAKKDRIKENWDEFFFSNLIVGQK